MLERGALLFKFVQPAGGSSEKEHLLWFEQMQELGFLVTVHGCILPYENFSGSSKGRPKGHKISAFFFKGNATAAETQRLVVSTHSACQIAIDNNYYRDFNCCLYPGSDAI